jgi:hypothetical protein
MSYITENQKIEEAYNSMYNIDESFSGLLTRKGLEQTAKKGAQELAVKGGTAAARATANAAKQKLALRVLRHPKAATRLAVQKTKQKARQKGAELLTKAATKMPKTANAARRVRDGYRAFKGTRVGQWISKWTPRLIKLAGAGLLLTSSTVKDLAIKAFTALSKALDPDKGIITAFGTKEKHYFLGEADQAPSDINGLFADWVSKNMTTNVKQSILNACIEATKAEGDAIDIDDLTEEEKNRMIGEFARNAIRGINPKDDDKTREEKIMANLEGNTVTSDDNKDDNANSSETDNDNSETKDEEKEANDVTNANDEQNAEDTQNNDDSTEANDADLKLLKQMFKKANL